MTLVLNNNSQDMTIEQMRAELARLKAENAGLKQVSARALSMKVSEKGALSVYGLGRFPVTLYRSQWIKLLDMAESIKSFIEAHKDSLAEKQ